MAILQIYRASPHYPFHTTIDVQRAKSGELQYLQLSDVLMEYPALELEDSLRKKMQTSSVTSKDVASFLEEATTSKLTWRLMTPVESIHSHVQSRTATRSLFERRTCKDTTKVCT
jgi:capsular polysaccharide biosynthesis protein